VVGEPGPGQRPVLPPFALLDTVAEQAAERARFWESHVLEVLTGLPAGAAEGQEPRPEFDPRLRTLTEREAAKAAELTAAGEPASVRTLARMRQRYESQGLWGLVDHRNTRLATPFGRVDERVVEAIAAAMDEQTDASTGTRERAWRRAKEILAARHPGQQVPLPSRATFYRVISSLEGARHTFGSAARRRSNANRPAAPFTVTTAQRPGEIVQIDTTPLDVMAVFDDGVTGRPELTITLDVATRTIGAAVLRPEGTKAVDASLLLARTVTAEPMRPGWAKALAMSRSVLPHRRLLGLDARLEHAAARPVIVPETIVCDRGNVFISHNFRAACASLGISFQPAHPHTPTDKPHIERTLESVSTLFCQFVSGYLGRSAEHRGGRVEDEPLWSLLELQELLDEWIVAVWQHRPHDGLRDPVTPGRAYTPNERYAALVESAGYVPVALSAQDYIELLPARWQAINSYGIKISHRVYDSVELNPWRRQPSGVTAKKNLWEVHHDPYDVSQVWVRNHHQGGWITATWKHLGSAPAWPGGGSSCRTTRSPWTCSPRRSGQRQRPAAPGPGLRPARAAVAVSRPARHGAARAHLARQAQHGAARLPPLHRHPHRGTHRHVVPARAQRLPAPSPVDRARRR
jgi:putative transposase